MPGIGGVWQALTRNEFAVTPQRLMHGIPINNEASRPRLALKLLETSTGIRYRTFCVRVPRTSIDAKGSVSFCTLTR